MGYDDCDWFLEEHPYVGQYTAETDSTDVWFEKITPDHCPYTKHFVGKTFAQSKRQVPLGEDPIETWLNMPPFDDVWAPYTPKAVQ